MFDIHVLPAHRRTSPERWGGEEHHSAESSDAEAGARFLSVGVIWYCLV